MKGVIFLLSRVKNECVAIEVEVKVGENFKWFEMKHEKV